MLRAWAHSPGQSTEGGDSGDTAWAHHGGEGGGQGMAGSLQREVWPGTRPHHSAPDRGTAPSLTTCGPGRARREAWRRGTETPGGSRAETGTQVWGAIRGPGEDPHVPGLRVTDPNLGSFPFPGLGLLTSRCGPSLVPSTLLEVGHRHPPASPRPPDAHPFSQSHAHIP